MSSWVVYILNDLAEEEGVELVYQMAFPGTCTIYLVFILFLIFILPFASHLGLSNLKRLEPGKTKVPSRSLLSACTFPIMKSIYKTRDVGVEKQTSWYSVLHGKETSLCTIAL